MCRVGDMITVPTLNLPLILQPPLNPQTPPAWGLPLFLVSHWSLSHGGAVGGD
jgi:hypothetical protein